MMVFVVIIYYWQRKFEPHLCFTEIENMMFFVCYDFDGDKNFVLNTILPELEENYDPPFILCINCRDFQPGYHIKWNIQEAIENSNSAIIVLSQDFINSIWCKEEFADCYVEHMRDPAFKLYVIMMQPVETLENTSEYIKSYFNSKTYLDFNDPNLFEKIGI